MSANGTHLTQATASLTSLVLYSSASRPLALLRSCASGMCCCCCSSAGAGSASGAAARAGGAWLRAAGCGGGMPCGRPEDCRSGGPLADDGLWRQGAVAAATIQLSQSACVICVINRTGCAQMRPCKWKTFASMLKEDCPCMLNSSSRKTKNDTVKRLSASFQRGGTDTARASALAREVMCRRPFCKQQQRPLIQWRQDHGFTHAAQNPALISVANAVGVVFMVGDRVGVEQVTVLIQHHLRMHVDTIHLGYLLPAGSSVLTAHCALAQDRAVPQPEAAQPNLARAARCCL